MDVVCTRVVRFVILRYSEGSLVNCATHERSFGVPQDDKIDICLRSESFDAPPLTPTLSPEYEGEGAGLRCSLLCEPPSDPHQHHYPYPDPTPRPDQVSPFREK